MSESKIIPFGKYRGQPIEVLQQDEQYLSWLRNQDWFVRDYQSINTVIINNFKEPDETPEHNQLQVLFLDDVFVDKFFEYIQKTEQRKNLQWVRKENTYSGGEMVDLGGVPDYSKRKVFFEQSAIDVTIQAPHVDTFLIELKPNISDDYPAVLRQVMNNKCPYVVCKSFTAKGATLEQARKVFAASGKSIILLSDITG